MKIGTGIVGMLVVGLLVIGCAGVTEDGEEANDEEVTGEDTSELQKLGCSNAQIRQAQASCRSGGLCPKGSRGIHYCKLSKTAGHEYDFSCACK